MLRLKWPRSKLHLKHHPLRVLPKLLENARKILKINLASTYPCTIPEPDDNKRQCFWLFEASNLLSLTPDMTRHVFFAMSPPTWIGQKVPNPLGTSKNPKPAFLTLEMETTSAKIQIQICTVSETRIPKSNTQNPKSKPPTKRLAAKWPEIHKSQHPKSKPKVWIGLGLVSLEFHNSKAQTPNELSQQRQQQQQQQQRQEEGHKLSRKYGFVPRTFLRSVLCVAKLARRILEFHIHHPRRTKQACPPHKHQASRFAPMEIWSDLWQFPACCIHYKSKKQNKTSLCKGNYPWWERKFHKQHDRKSLRTLQDLRGDYGTGWC